jgi:transcriptional regulator with XRE-family HTH domain
MSQLTRSEAQIYGEALARLRTRARMSQAEAADKLGISQQAWQKYEKAISQQMLNVAVQRRTAEALGFTLEDLTAEAQAVIDGRPMFGTLPTIVEPAAANDRRDLMFPLDGTVKAGPTGPAVYDSGNETYDLGILLDDDTRILRVVGDSMAPIVESGGYVSYRLRGFPKRGQLCVIRYKDGQYFAKKFIRMTDKDVECIQMETTSLDGATAYVERAVKYPLSDVEAVYPAGVRLD